MQSHRLDRSPGRHASWHGVIAEAVPRPEAPVAAQCAFALKWGIHWTLLERIQVMQREAPFGLTIISGARSRAEQEQLSREGRPTADFNLSTHASETENGCPRLATGADLWPDVAVVPLVKAHFGTAAVFAGLRWGGGSSIDPETGIPSDWNHVDLGPRSAVP